MYRAPSVACSPDPGWLCFLHVAPVLPFPPSAQGFDVVDTCVVARFAVPFISPAIRARASCLFSISKAWPTSIKNSEHTSAAPIESRAEFLYMFHRLMVVMVTIFWPYSKATNMPVDPVRGSGMFAVDLLDLLARLSRWMPRRVPWQSTRIESNLIMIESDWMQCIALPGC